MGLVVGLDYGTESARGVLLDPQTGQALAEKVHPYRHGVIDRQLANGPTLPADWALQDADDYLEAAQEILTYLVQVAPQGRTIAGIGIAFTASTPLPALANGAPLSRLYPQQPHAYVKLWKHHSAQPWADQINRSGAQFLRWYGGRTSSEWLPAKALELAAEAPELWRQTQRFIEGGDWVAWQLTGHETRSSCQAGYKAHYLEGQGYQVDPATQSRLQPPTAIGQAVGTLTADWQQRTGLSAHTVVAVATIDAHAAMPGVGVSQPGQLVGILGTSACHMLLAHQQLEIPGISGVVRDGIVPGMWGYEAGQAGFGDILNWFVRSFPHGTSEAESFAYYNQQAAHWLGRGSLVALDWWNGCRTPLVRADLSGVLVGLTLHTTPAQIYLALLESLCYGTQKVLQTFAGGGLQVEQLVLTGGLAERNPLLMQLMANITQRSVVVPQVSHATARGAAIHAMVAAGLSPDFAQATRQLAPQSQTEYQPQNAHLDHYQQRYRFYSQLSDFFAQNDGMAQLRQ